MMWFVCVMKCLTPRFRPHRSAPSHACLSTGGGSRGRGPADPRTPNFVRWGKRCLKRDRRRPPWSSPSLQADAGSDQHSHARLRRVPVRASVPRKTITQSTAMPICKVFSHSLQRRLHGKSKTCVSCCRVHTLGLSGIHSPLQRMPGIIGSCSPTTNRNCFSFHILSLRG